MEFLPLCFMSYTVHSFCCYSDILHIQVKEAEENFKQLILMEAKEKGALQALTDLNPIALMVRCLLLCLRRRKRHQERECVLRMDMCKRIFV
jgi:hypothetical protein